MTDHSRSSRRLVIIGAALLAAAAVAMVLGVVPPVRSDTFSQAAPRSASAAFLVNAAIAALAALALGFVAARGPGRPWASVPVLYVISALVFLLGLVLLGPALTFRTHGAALYGAIFFMFVSAAAEFAAAGLVAVAATRLHKIIPAAATADNTSAWKARVAPAVLLGMGSFFLMFLVGEGMEGATTGPLAGHGGELILAVAVGGYSLLATWALSRDLPRARGNLWIVLALNAVLLLSALVALLVEPNKSAALQVLGVAIASSAGSYGGLALAARTGSP